MHGMHYANRYNHFEVETQQHGLGFEDSPQRPTWKTVHYYRNYSYPGIAVWTTYY